jgi:hypothetical protein
VAVWIVTEAEPVKLPPLGVIVGVATAGKLTVKPNVVVLVTPAPLTVTMMVELPAGVEPVVVMVNTEEQFGLQLPEEKEAVVPVGNPEAINETGWVVPELKVAVMVLVTEDPATTDLSPELESAKLNIGVIVKDALASALGFDPFLKAFALTVALLVKVKAPA